MDIKVAFPYIVELEMWLGLHLVISVCLLQSPSSIVAKVPFLLSLCRQLSRLAVSEPIQTLNRNQCWFMALAFENFIRAATRERVLWVYHKSTVLYMCIYAAAPEVQAASPLPQVHEQCHTALEAH